MQRRSVASARSPVPLLALAVTAAVVVLGLGGCQTTGGKAAPEAAPGRAAEPEAPAKREAKDQSVEGLHAALSDPELMTRLGAVEELGRRVPSSPPASAALVEALSDAHPLVRRFAAGGLSNEQAPSTAAVLALARLLHDPELDPRESSARTLAKLAPRAPAETVAELGAALTAAAGDSNEGVRALAVEALGGLGARGARAVPAMRPALERALGDPDVRVRAAAAGAVGQLGAAVPAPPWAMALLTKALYDPVHDVRKMAVIACEKIGPAAAPAATGLARQLHGKEIYLRVFAADALTAIGPGARSALPDLKALAARGYRDLEGSPEMEAKDLPAAVDRAIRSLEGKAPKS